MKNWLTKWVTNNLENFFRAEIANERNGGITPSTLSSAIDSLSQYPDGFRLTLDDVVALLLIRDNLPGDTELREFL